MGSLDNMPLEETINICTNLLYNNEDVIEGIKKSELKNLLSLGTQESYFILNDILYKQKDGVTMGSSLGPTMTNVFLSFYEVKWVEQYRKEFKAVFYKRYLSEDIWKFCDYFNTCHPNMFFSFEQERNGKLSYLDIEVSREKIKFVYRKPTFSGVYTHFESSLSTLCKLVWFIFLLIVVSKFFMIGQSFMKNLVF